MAAKAPGLSEATGAYPIPPPTSAGRALSPFREHMAALLAVAQAENAERHAEPRAAGSGPRALESYLRPGCDEWQPGDTPKR